VPIFTLLKLYYYIDMPGWYKVKTKLTTDGTIESAAEPEKRVYHVQIGGK